MNNTDYSFGTLYRGKVRDNYTVGKKRIIISTDRISCFDRVVATLPFKGQVLNQTALFWFDKTKHIVSNHVLSSPDPNILIGKECKPYPIEMVVRGYLTGVTPTSAWYNYEKGVRNFCGNALPEGMKKNEKFDQPILTPSTKAEKGDHDESVGKEYFVKNNLIDEKKYAQIEQVALQLFHSGSEWCAKNNLILVDTKYEFGEYDGELILIDEVHTPDSSRFLVKDSYDKLFSEGKDPHKLDKEFVRQWLADNGFMGEGEIPIIPDDVLIEATQRYIEAYELITGSSFNITDEPITDRIKQNLKEFL